MTDLPFDIWQIIAFGGPIIITLVVYSVGLFSGQKTNITAGLSGLLAGLEVIDFGWIPEMYANPLITGFAVSTLLSNTLLTKRKDGPQHA